MNHQGNKRREIPPLFPTETVSPDVEAIRTVEAGLWGLISGVSVVGSLLGLMVAAVSLGGSVGAPAFPLFILIGLYYIVRARHRGRFGRRRG